jgi:hypothetical protein
VSARPGHDDEGDAAALAGWARELGVTDEVMRRLVEQRRALVFDVADDPRAWGFDLLPARAPRREAAAEFRRATRLTGALAESFLAEHGALLALVPEPPTMPDGTPLDELLVRTARLAPEPARAVAHHVRTTLQATLGAPLTREAVERAAREASWDHDLDAARTIEAVTLAMRQVL